MTMRSLCFHKIINIVCYQNIKDQLLTNSKIRKCFENSDSTRRTALNARMEFTFFARAQRISIYMQCLWPKLLEMLILAKIDKATVQNAATTRVCGAENNRKLKHTPGDRRTSLMATSPAIIIIDSALSLNFSHDSHATTTTKKIFKLNVLS